MQPAPLSVMSKAIGPVCFAFCGLFLGGVGSGGGGGGGGGGGWRVIRIRQGDNCPAGSAVIRIRQGDNCPAGSAVAVITQLFFIIIS